MCGIAGVLHPPSQRAVAADVWRACRAMRHRGPDEDGIHVDGHVGLGITRLAIVGRRAGSQPAHAADGAIVCVGNGEIYNHRELRRRLERLGHPVEGGSDIHVIPALFAALGDDFVDELDGMFAFALYDRRTGCLTLATDRLGKKPLVYSRRADGSVVFASELSALLTFPGVDRRTDHVALDHYLSYRFVPAPHTIFASVAKLVPASIVRIDGDGGLVERRYWTAGVAGLEHEATLDGLSRRVTKAVEAAVVARLEADVPIGGLLSGGLDSSLVTAVACRHVDEPIRTFSVGFAEALFDESDAAAAVSAHLGTRHRSIRIGPDDALDCVDRILHHMGEPFAFPSAIASYHMFRLASEDVGVVLTGDGADETFGGYDRYKVMDRLPAIDPEHAHRVDIDLLARAGTDLARRYEAVLVDGIRDGLKRRICRPDALAELQVDHMSARFAATTGPDLHRLLAVDIEHWLPGAQLVKVDRMSMASSVEARSPLLDHRLVDLACGIHPRHKLQPTIDKAILRRCARPYLGEAFAARRKQELAVPLADWLAGPLRAPVRAILLSDRSLERGYFRPDAIVSLVDDGDRRDAYALWTLFMLERWHQLLEGGPDEPLATDDHSLQGSAR